MKLENVLEILRKHEKGFMIHFEILGKTTTRTDYFPEKGEEDLFATEEEAWKFARRFAHASKNDGNIVNVCVVDQDYNKISGEPINPY